MADDPNKRDARNRASVAGEQGYEVGYFARKHGISRDQARELIEAIGNDRDKLNAAASRLRKPPRK